MTEIALITGANKGIGFHTARLLGARGMTVLVGARDARAGEDAERELREGGADARFVHLDVTSSKLISAAAERIESEHGHLDVLVNNAGVSRVPGNLPGVAPSQTSLDAMRALFETNLFGVIAVTNAMLPLLRRAPAGRIVNVSSEVGSIGAMTDTSTALGQMPPSLPYPVSKSALNMVGALYAKELRDTSVRVYLANPGYCATDLNGNSGFGTAEQGAEVSVALATDPPDDAEGRLWGHVWGTEDAYGVLPW